MEKFDIAILGAGPGGYIAAIRAAQLGFKTCLIEKDLLGGTCLNRGCIPTKCFADLAHTLEKSRKAAGSGLLFDSFQVKMPEIVAWKDRVVKNLRNGINYLLKSNGVFLLSGEGRLVSTDGILVSGEEVKARNIILATGSSPAKPKIFPFGDGRFITSDEILEMESLPESLAVVGGGAIGCEFASIFASFGCRLAIYEMLSHLLPLEDAEMGVALERSFKKRGIEVTVGRPAELSELERFEKVLVAVGRQPNTKGIGLEEVGVALDEKGFVKTKEDFATSIQHIYAIGDISGKGQLAYLASEQGISVVERLAGREHPVDYNLLPSCVFTLPEVGTFGITEERLKDKRTDYQVGKFPFTALGKAYCINETEGFVKIIAESQTGRIVGCQIIGPSATELIHIVSAVARAEGTVETLIDSIFGHPTLAESVKEAAQACLGRAIHLPKVSSG